MEFTIIGAYYENGYVYTHAYYINLENFLDLKEFMVKEGMFEAEKITHILYILEGHVGIASLETSSFQVAQPVELS